MAKSLALSQVQELDGIARQSDGLIPRSLIDLISALVVVAVSTAPRPLRIALIRTSVPDQAGHYAHRTFRRMQSLLLLSRTSWSPPA